MTDKQMPSFRIQIRKLSEPKVKNETTPTRSDEIARFRFLMNIFPGDCTHYFSQIQENLFLSGAEVITRDALNTYGIQRILNIGATYKADFIIPSHIEYMKVIAEDTSDEPLLANLEDMATFIDSGFAEYTHPVPTLVHCQAGRSRSPAVVIGYLMISTKLTLRQAIEVVAFNRRGLSINDGFIKQILCVADSLNKNDIK